MRAIRSARPISASIRIASAYAELQSQLGGHWFSALNARYDDNGRFGSKVTYRIAPTWVSSESGTNSRPASHWIQGADAE